MTGKWTGKLTETPYSDNGQLSTNGTKQGENREDKGKKKNAKTLLQGENADLDVKKALLTAVSKAF